jgi:hypothetical protein
MMQVIIQFGFSIYVQGCIASMCSWTLSSDSNSAPQKGQRARSVRWRRFRPRSGCSSCIMPPPAHDCIGIMPPPAHPRLHRHRVAPGRRPSCLGRPGARRGCRGCHGPSGAARSSDPGRHLHASAGPRLHRHRVAPRLHRHHVAPAAPASAPEGRRPASWLLVDALKSRCVFFTPALNPSLPPLRTRPTNAASSTAVFIRCTCAAAARVTSCLMLVVVVLSRSAHDLRSDHFPEYIKTITKKGKLARKYLLSGDVLLFFQYSTTRSSTDE